MPQKLIRLTSESNDGIFNGLFDQDIEIKRDSEIALQSLTLEKLSTRFDVNDSNNTITFSAKVGSAGYIQIAKIDKKLYEEEDSAQLMKSIQTGCNAAGDMILQTETMNIQWKADIDEINDKVEIAVRPSPFFPLIVFNELPATPVELLNTTSIKDRPTVIGVTGNATPVMGAGGFGRLTETVNGTLNECYLYNTMQFIKSTGSFRIRLAAISEQTVDRPAFTIGLVDEAGLDKLNDATITIADLSYAIQVDARSTNPATGGYSFLTEADSTFADTNPFAKIVRASRDGSEELNDVMEIVIRDGILQGYIHRNGVAVYELPASTTTYTNTELYPVVFCHLASTTGPVVNNTIDMIQCSLDPWQRYVSAVDDEWPIYLDANPQLEPEESTLASVVQYDSGAQEVDFTPEFTFEKDSIAKYLGYSSKELTTGDDDAKVGLGSELTDTVSGVPYTREEGFILGGKTPFASAVDADSYLVDTQSFTLDSYDSYGLSANERSANSGGSRRNLLATIPATELALVGSQNSRVIYEPQTLNYIAIKNRSDVITRQIRMRLLDARYGTVSMAGLSAMTVLIRDKE